MNQDAAEVARRRDEDRSEQEGAAEPIAANASPFVPDRKRGCNECPAGRRGAEPAVQVEHWLSRPGPTPGVEPTECRSDSRPGRPQNDAEVDRRGGSQSTA